MKKRLFCLILAVLGLTSCSSYRYTASLQPEYERMYVGKSHNYIVSAMGAPDRTTSDGNGGQILIYERTVMLSQQVATNVDVWSGTYTPGTYSSTNTSYVHFFVNQSGNCYRVNTNLTEERIDQKKYNKATRGGAIFGILYFVVPFAVGGIIALCSGALSN